MIPKPLQELASHFDALPGLGPRAALRYAYWLAGQSKEQISQFARAISGLNDSMHVCADCFAWTDAERCDICTDSLRDKTLLCIVSAPQDIRVIESTHTFKGVYHVLGGLLDPVSGRTPDTLTLDALFARVANPANHIQEMIIALDPDVLGDTTSQYIIKKLQNSGCVITRIARGLTHGAHIEYADPATMTDALNNRRRA